MYQALTTTNRRGDVVQKRVKLHAADQLQAALTLWAFGGKLQGLSEGFKGPADILQSKVSISQAQKGQGLKRREKRNQQNVNELLGFEKQKTFTVYVFELFLGCSAKVTANSFVLFTPVLVKIKNH